MHQIALNKGDIKVKASDTTTIRTNMKQGGPINRGCQQTTNINIKNNNTCNSHLGTSGICFNKEGIPRLLFK